MIAVTASLLREEVLGDLCIHFLVCKSINHTGMLWRNDTGASSGKNVHLRIVRFFEPRGSMVSGYSILKNSH